MERDKENKITVEGSLVEKRDLMASNGVVHTINDIVIPDSGK